MASTLELSILDVIVTGVSSDIKVTANASMVIAINGGDVNILSTLKMFLYLRPKFQDFFTVLAFENFEE